MVAYNIQIFDNNTNKLVYETVSTESQRKIKEQISEISSWLSVQDEKLDKINEAKTQYNSSQLKVTFKNTLTKNVATNRTKIADMEKILGNKKAGKTLSQSDITKYFQYWNEMLTSCKTSIGDLESPKSGSGEYILKTINDWLNVDPNRKDGIEYKNEDVVLYDRTKMNAVLAIFNSAKVYYESTIKARESLGASDTTYINDTTFSKAKQIGYLAYSEFANEAYFGKDLYTAVNDVWTSCNLDGLYSKCTEVGLQWNNEVSSLEYALAHLSGGYTNKITNIYKIATASDANIIASLPVNTAVAILESSPAGWYHISYAGQDAYIQTANVTMYNIKQGKFYLDEPVYPTNYEGEKNTITHQIPINVLQNGKAYKWSVTLYWSTSGKYDKDDKIDGVLVSVENYFDTRKRPIVDLANYKEVFTISNNYVTTKTDIQIVVEEYGESKTINVKQGSNVLILHLDESETIAFIQFTDRDTNKTYEGTCSVSSLNGIGAYDSDGKKTYILGSREATFKGLYEQEQFTSIAYFRWILYKLNYQTELIEETVVDTGLIPSVDFKFHYDGFLNDTKYALKIWVQTLDNVEVETDLIQFTVQYIQYEIENMLGAENSPIEHGIIVEWSNLRLIEGELNGTGHYEKNIPSGEKNAYTLDKGSSLLFDKDKGRPMELDFDANQVLCTRFDEDRPINPQVVYLASGLNDNGDVVSKTLELIPDDRTQSTGWGVLRYTVNNGKEVISYEQDIIMSPLYWYVIIMTSTGFKVFTKYAKGLFPALDQYPSLDKWTGSQAVYPEPLIYLEEESDRVEYHYQKIVDRDGNPLPQDEEHIGDEVQSDLELAPQSEEIEQSNDNMTLEDLQNQINEEETKENNLEQLQQSIEEETKQIIEKKNKKEEGEE